MTKEEFKQKQKIEKRFEKWFRKYVLCCDCKKKCTCIQLNAYCEKLVKQAYIAGATENGIQWHDLRKDPNDLPKKVGNYLVCYLDTMLERHSFELSYVDYLEDGHWIDEGNHNIERYDEGVIAWCEIPLFKEQDK